jgi:hypothetical protein
VCDVESHSLNRLKLLNEEVKTPKNKGTQKSEFND